MIYIKRSHGKLQRCFVIVIFGLKYFRFYLWFSLLPTLIDQITSTKFDFKRGCTNLGKGSNSSNVTRQPSN